MIYLIGSLRNPEIPIIASKFREAGCEVFDDWYAAGPEADDKWREYEMARGRSYIEALSGLAADHVFHFDKVHLERASAVVLVLPAGKSGHLELGFSIGQGKPGYILLDNPDRWDVMYKFATMVTTKLEEIVNELEGRSNPLGDELNPLSLLYGAGEPVWKGPVLGWCSYNDDGSIPDAGIDETV